MALITNRIIFSNDGVISDLTTTLNNIESQTSVIPFIADEDFIYIGSDLPFNHRYFSISVSNALPSVISVSFWSGTEWVSSVDLMDQTSVGGASFSRSGIISWSKDIEDSWSIGNTEDIDGLETIKIFDLFWAKISFSADLTLTTAIKYVGHKFSEDEDLGTYYPELVLANTITQFKAAKTNWEEQHVAAAESIIREIKLKTKIISGSQLLSWDLFTEPAVHKVAEIIFNAFGDDYKDNKDEAIKSYKNSFRMETVHADRNKNLKLDPFEKIVPARVFRR